VGDKSNEIPAVKELLDLLDIKEEIITMDAMHCQKETVQKIVDKKGHYVIQLKSNQKLLYKATKGLFEKYEGLGKRETTHTKGHGRFETRTCEILPRRFIKRDGFNEWAGLENVFRIRRITEKDGEISQEDSYYLTDLDKTPKEFLEIVRKHWKIESFHWILDKVMGEDGSCTRDKNAQDCLNRMRKFAIAVIKRYIEHANPKKKSISGNMRLCLFSCDYLENLIDFFLHFFLLHL